MEPSIRENCGYCSCIRQYRAVYRPP